MTGGCSGYATPRLRWASWDFPLQRPDTLRYVTLLSCHRDSVRRAKAKPLHHGLGGEASSRRRLTSKMPLCSTLTQRSSYVIPQGIVFLYSHRQPQQPVRSPLRTGHHSTLLGLGRWHHMASVVDGWGRIQFRINTLRYDAIATCNGFQRSIPTFTNPMPSTCASFHDIPKGHGHGYGSIFAVTPAVFPTRHTAPLQVATPCRPTLFLVPSSPVHCAEASTLPHAPTPTLRASTNVRQPPRSMCMLQPPHRAPTQPRAFHRHCEDHSFTIPP